MCTIEYWVNIRTRPTWSSWRTKYSEKRIYKIRVGKTHKFQRGPITGVQKKKKETETKR